MRVERAAPKVAELFEQLKAAKADEAVSVSRISAKDFRALQSMAYRSGCKVGKIEGEDGKVSLVMRASRAPFVRPTRPSPLAVQTPADEEQRFAASMEKLSRERRIPVPSWSQTLALIKELGYRLVGPPSATA
jgi:hypothetical protein